MAGMSRYGQPYKYRDTKKEYYFKRFPIYGNVKYSKEMNENSTLNINAYANYYQFSREKKKFIHSDTDTLKETSTNPLNTLLFGTDIDYNIKTDKHDFIAGISWQQDRAMDIHEDITYAIDPSDIGREEAIQDPNVFRDDIGLFIQDVFAINDNINLTGGLRYDILTRFDNQFNYRFGLTGQFDNNVYAKLLYGTAYRVPSYREYLTTDAPNAALTPEQLSTLEAQIGYLISSKADINLTFYNNNYTNFIQEIVVDSIDDGSGNFAIVDDEMAFNWESRSITGLELNANIRPSKIVSMNVGGSYILKATEILGTIDPNIYTGQTLIAGETDITFLSKFTAFLVSNFRIKENYGIGLNIIYFGDRNTPADYQTDSDIMNASNADGFVKLDLTASARLLDKKLTLALKVANLLDADIYSPPYGGSDGYDIEWPGRTLRFSANYRF